MCHHVEYSSELCSLATFTRLSLRNSEIVGCYALISVVVCKLMGGKTPWQQMKMKFKNIVETGETMCLQSCRFIDWITAGIQVYGGLFPSTSPPLPSPGPGGGGQGLNGYIKTPTAFFENVNKGYFFHLKSKH